MPFIPAAPVAVIATVFLGFARSYFLRSRYFSTPLPPIAKVHGAIFLSWTLLFLVQTVLVARLAGAMVVAGTAIAIASLRYNFATGNQGALSFFAIPMGNMLVFLILVTAALVWRRRTETHKRLMLLATINVIDAVVARWPLAILSNGPAAFFALTDLYILAGVLYDLACHRRVHPAYLWGGLLIVGAQTVRLAIWHTAAWIGFARMIAA